MAFNVDAFKSEISTRGTLQTNKFEVEIPMPLKLVGLGFGNSTSMLQVRAENVRLPGMSLDLTSVNRYGIGPKQRLPFNVNFTDNSITFIEDGQNTIWKYFYVWMNSIFDYSGLQQTRINTLPTYQVEYKKQYCTDIKVKVFDTVGTLITTLVMKEAYPTNLGDVGLSWADNNQLFRVNVGFTFREWYLDNFNLSGVNNMPQPVNLPSPQGPTVSNQVDLAPVPSNNGQPRTMNLPFNPNQLPYQPVTIP